LKRPFLKRFFPERLFSHALFSATLSLSTSSLVKIKDVVVPSVEVAVIFALPMGAQHPNHPFEFFGEDHHAKNKSPQ
jgi:hypothetical protein